MESAPPSKIAFIAFSIFALFAVFGVWLIGNFIAALYITGLCIVWYSFLGQALQKALDDLTS